MYFVYMLQCGDNSFYTGYTNDVDKRVRVHNEGKGSKYTRARLPVKIVYVEEFATKREAMKREVEIKKLSRVQKEQLIQTSFNRMCPDYINKKD